MAMRWEHHRENEAVDNRDGARTVNDGDEAVNDRDEAGELDAGGFCSL